MLVPSYKKHLKQVSLTDDSRIPPLMELSALRSYICRLLVLLLNSLELLKYATQATVSRGLRLILLPKLRKF